MIFHLQKFLGYVGIGRLAHRNVRRNKEQAHEARVAKLPIEWSEFAVYLDSLGGDHPGDRNLRHRAIGEFIATGPPLLTRDDYLALTGRGARTETLGQLSMRVHSFGKWGKINGLEDLIILDLPEKRRKHVIDKPREF